MVTNRIELLFSKALQAERIVDGPSAEIEPAVNVLRRRKAGFWIGAVRAVREGYFRSRDRYSAYVANRGGRSADLTIGTFWRRGNILFGARRQFYLRERELSGGGLDKKRCSG